ncbi:beta-N-acetylhexosaminidase [Saccharobesus litoralis]|uniref:Beta-hexosaminidase n=1 Tax=Saccharobesus litoralis TaxID=2172099 RepID=A0A2S0VXX0_9ALTE|nr:beta-N-acetylhexosaminidase [Saccharobesus litoralis]
MLDVEGFELTTEDKEIIEHPYVGGVILFSRNYHDKAQLTELNRQIRLASRTPILIAVDHEGGRVQRFRDHFATIPPAAIYEKLSADNIKIARELGWLMAIELLATGVDLSFAPVLDLNRLSSVIGERAFSAQPEQVVKFASAFIRGMNDAGMKACGKHFPGHGSVEADSHVAEPVDGRDLKTIEQVDMLPFAELIKSNMLDAIMPAHVIYSQVDSQPAGFSEYWLQSVLRKKLGFNGVIFSDDLSMQAANIAGDYVSKATVALKAGCDFLLACNNRNGAVSIIDAVASLPVREVNNQLIATLKSDVDAKALYQSERYKSAYQLSNRLI